MNSNYFATCPKGLESLLKQELTDLGSSEVRETVAGVYFAGGLEVAYRACLWSRLANKVLLPLEKGPIRVASELYSTANAIPWEEHLPENGTLVVDFLGTNQAIRHTQFGAQTVKDAVVDRLKDTRGERPSVDKEQPDLRINVRLAKDVAHISLDLSGESLHKRGYRLGRGEAPLKENLAAAILLRAGWSEIAARGGALLDPMCGSGTFLIEAAMMAADMAPGLIRARAVSELNSEELLVGEFGFVRWAKHDTDLWQTLLNEAQARFIAGRAQTIPEIRGYDNDPRVLGNARKNICGAALDDYIRVTLKPLEEFKKPTHTNLQDGLMVCNPPYGERLGEINALRYTYQVLGGVAKRELPGWVLAVFTGNKELAKAIGLWANKKYQLFNGAIASELLLYELRESGEQVISQNAMPVQGDTPQSLLHTPLSEGAQMVYNRLLKNRKRLNKWLENQAITCYRVYDADMPEYAAAIDVYVSVDGDLRLHIQEYAAPKTVDEEKARLRFNELQHACVHAFKLQEHQLVTKQRVRNRGKQQYEKHDSSARELLFVKENFAELQINLRDYLDSGLFLDHRPLRLRIAKEARGKRFLNLFCYTATATVHAALAGASESVSVDMSNTYLDWARINFERNHINLKNHQLVRHNCVDWLNACRQGFDLIMLDPPSFSNSKKMAGVLDIQRDHVSLIKRCMELLNPGGRLYFSNNLRSFKLDQAALSHYKISDITQQTLDPDFQQNPKIHQCWQVEAV